MLYSYELEKFLEQLLPERDPLLHELEEQALRETIPIVTPSVGNFLALLVRNCGARNILEIGTATGYSTLWLAKAAGSTGGQIITIDMNAGRQKQALQNFERAGFSGRITALSGDARKILPTLNQKFDFIFVDAAKGEYLEYLALLKPMLQAKGMLVVDNVLFRGWVVPEAVFAPKYNNMVNMVRTFLERISKDQEFTTSVLPLGDGLSISIRR